MRKILKLIIPSLAVLVLLTACSSEKTKVYTKSIDNQDIQVTIYYKGDSINKIVSENTLTVGGDDINSTIESIKKSIKDNNGHPIDNIAGYSYKVEEKDRKIHITWETDYNKLDFDKYKSTFNIPVNSLDEAKKLSTVEKKLTTDEYKEKK
ncbi:DUF1307 domain-containing protein [Gemella sanguinis]